MSDKEKLKKIYLKTYVVLMAVVMVAIMFSIIISFIQYDSYYIDEFYRASFIINNTIYFFNKNLLFLIAVFNLFTFSIMISKTDITVSSDKTLFFYQLTSRAIYILLFFTAYYFLTIEVINPILTEKIEQQKINTKRSRDLFTTAESYYKTGENDKALLYFEQFMIINDRNEYVKDAVRKLRLDSKREKSVVMRTEDDFPDKVNYVELAELYDKRGEYLTAWYYYEHVIESDSSRRDEVKARVEEIKQILAYKNRMLKGEDKERWLEQNLRMIKQVHEMRKEASDYYNRREFQKSYFIYQDILAYNNRIRDSIVGLEQSLYNLSALSVETSKIRSKELFSGKSNFVFTTSNRNSIYIRELKKVVDEESGRTLYYFYDIKIYRFDEQNELESIISSPYGELKSNNVLTLYSYMKSDRNIEFYPLLEKVKKDSFERYILRESSLEEEARLKSLYSPEGSYYTLNENTAEEDKIFAGRIIAKSRYNLFNSPPSEIDRFYYEGELQTEVKQVLSSNSALRYSYNLTFQGESPKYLLDKYYIFEDGYYELKPELSEDDKRELWEVLKGTDIRIYPFFFPLDIDIDVLYNFSYDYENAINFPLRKLSGLIDFTMTISEDESGVGSGFNNSFLITAVLDKIASVFIFFFLNILIISFAWRKRAQYFGAIPYRYFISFIIIAIFSYIFIEGVKYLSTEFYALLAYSTALPLGVLVAICIIINIIITAISLSYLAATRVQNQD